MSVIVFINDSPSISTLHSVHARQPEASWFLPRLTVFFWIWPVLSLYLYFGSSCTTLWFGTHTQPLNRQKRIFDIAVDKVHGAIFPSRYSHRLIEPCDGETASAEVTYYDNHIAWFASKWDQCKNASVYLFCISLCVKKRNQISYWIMKGTIQGTEV